MYFNIARNANYDTRKIYNFVRKSQNISLKTASNTQKDKVSISVQCIMYNVHAYKGQKTSFTKCNLWLYQTNCYIAKLNYIKMYIYFSIEFGFENSLDTHLRLEICEVLGQFKLRKFAKFNLICKQIFFNLFNTI